MRHRPRFSFARCPLTAKGSAPAGAYGDRRQSCPRRATTLDQPAIQGNGIDLRRGAMAGASRSSADLDAATPCRGRMVLRSYAPRESVREARSVAGFRWLAHCPLACAPSLRRFGNTSYQAPARYQNESRWATTAPLRAAPEVAHRDAACFDILLECPLCFAHEPL
jgi:hypothetical protein